MPFNTHGRRPVHHTIQWLMLLGGACIAALGIQAILIPNNLIDGGITGLSLIFSKLLGPATLPIFLVLLNAPLLWWGGKQLGRRFVVSGLVAVVTMALCCHLVSLQPHLWLEKLRDLEGIVLGGCVVGFGIGLVIRAGGCTDGSEAVALLLQRKTGFTVGQIILVANLAIFAISIWVFDTWRTGFYSLLVYLVAAKVMDIVIVGLDETKSVMIISRKYKAVAEKLMEDLGVGLTFFNGRGGYSGDAQEIIYVVVERLQLARLKTCVQSVDPGAFIAVENLHEVINARVRAIATRRLRRKMGLAGIRTNVEEPSHDRS